MGSEFDGKKIVSAGAGDGSQDAITATARG
jgi:hypothetical protein